MDNIILQKYGIYDNNIISNDFYYYMFGIGSYLLYLIDKYIYLPQQINKKINTNNECLISLNIIQYNENYYLCHRCNNIYICNYFDEWIIKSKKNNCPYCLFPINTNTIYINK
jgi:hypothetical protein